MKVKELDMDMNVDFQRVSCNIICPSDEFTKEVYSLLVDENGEVDFSILLPIELKDIKHVDDVWGTFGCEEVHLDKEANRIVLFAKGKAPFPVFDELARRYENESFAVLVDGPDETVDHGVFVYGFRQLIDVTEFGLNIKQEEIPSLTEEGYLQRYQEMSNAMEDYAFSKMREVYDELEDTSAKEEYEESVEEDESVKNKLSDLELSPEERRESEKRTEEMVDSWGEETDPEIRKDLEENGGEYYEYAPSSDDPEGE